MSRAIVLYELVAKTAESGLNISPSVWKTKVDLFILKVPYIVSGKSFHQIRTELSELTGNLRVTVPTILVDGKIITDSWLIAEYLDEHYGSVDVSLFARSQAGKSFAKLIEIWSMTSLANELRPLLSPAIDPTLDVPSGTYVFQSKHKSDQAAVDLMRHNASDPSYVTIRCAAVRSELKIIETLLGNDRVFLMGSDPSHADACLFGWYAFSRVNRDLVTEVWEHHSLPKVSRWVGSMLERGLANRNEMY